MHTGAAYLTVILVWATTPLAIKWSAEAGAPVGALALRMMISVLVGILLLWMLGGRLQWHRRAVLSYAAAVPGVFGAMALAYRASMSLPSGLISVMFGLAPLLSGLMMQIMPQPIRLSGWHWAGCLLGVVGLAVVFMEALLPGDTPLAPVLMLLLAVTCFSASALGTSE